MRRILLLIGIFTTLFLLHAETASAQRSGPSSRNRRDTVWRMRTGSDSLRRAKLDSVRQGIRDSIARATRDSIEQVRRDAAWQALQDSLRSSPADSARIAREDSIWSAQQDSVWRDLGLEPEGFDIESDLFTHYSHGWFPQTHAAQSLSLTSTWLYANVWDAGTSIRSRSFVPTVAPFGWRDPYDSGERKIKKSNSNDDEDDPFPFTLFGEYGLTYTLNLPMPLVLRADAALQIADGMIFASDTTRSYLTLSGLKRPMKEVSVLHLQQYLLAGKVGVNIPVYGVFLEWESLTVASYYYLHASVSAGYAVSSKATQFMQIADVKDELRYGNGTDTVVVMEAVRLSELDRLRTSIDVGIGWNFSAAFGTFYVEAFASVPMNTIVKDAEWRQYYAGLRVGIGFQWLPEEKEPGK